MHVSTTKGASYYQRATGGGMGRGRPGPIAQRGEELARRPARDDRTKATLRWRIAMLPARLRMRSLPRAGR